MDQLAILLKEARANKGLNKSEMADKLGISSQLYGQYENKQKTPGGAFFLKWKEVFGEDLLTKIKTKVSREVSEGKETEEIGTIYSLAESNRILAVANKTLADAHIIIARGNEELIQLARQVMISFHKPTSDDQVASPKEAGGFVEATDTDRGTPFVNLKKRKHAGSVKEKDK